MTEPPGFYGKAPVLGDFLSRRMPAGFGTVWHDFLAGIVAGSRDRLGAAWLDWWNEAPVWHFVLGAGVAGPAPWCGVLIPSLDRVGRQFPFTVLGATDPAGREYEGWALAAEALTLGALEDGFSTAQLAQDLQGLGYAAPPPDGAEAGTTLWWCREAPRMHASRLRWQGLPGADRAADLVGAAP